MTAATIGMVTSPVPAGRSATAFLARARSFLAPIAYDALLRLCLAEIWLLFAAWVVKDVARIAGAKDCAAAVAASKVSAFCEDHFLYAFAIVMTLFVHRLDDADIRGAWMEVRCRTIMIELSGAIPFILLMIVGELMEEALSVKGSRAQAIGGVISAVGFLGKDAVVCFLVIPTAALKVWKVTRPGWVSSSSTVEEKNTEEEKVL